MGYAETLHPILDTVLDAFILVDQAGLIRYLNPAAKQMFGFHECHAIGQSLVDRLVSPAFRPAHRHAIQSFLFPQNGHHIGRRVELTGFRLDGTPFPVDLAISKVSIGGRAQFAVCLRDITERMKSDLDVLDRERQLRAIFEQVALGGVQFDLDGNVLRANRRFCELVGRSLEQILNQSFYDTIYEPDRPSSRIIVKQLLAGEQHSSIFEKRLVRKEGMLVWCRLTLSVIQIDENLPPTILALVEDITAQRRLEAERNALLEQERRTRAEAVAYARDYEAIFEAITDSVTVYDTQGNILRMNHAARALLGIEHMPDFDTYPLQERQNRFQVMDADGQPLPTEQWPFQRILRGEILTNANLQDLSMVNCAGQTFHISASGAPIRGDNGRVMGVVLILRDVTERRNLENRTREALASLLEIAEVLVATDTHPVYQDLEGVLVHHLADLALSVIGCRRLAVIALTSDEILHPLVVLGVPSKREQQWVTGKKLRHLRDWVSPDHYAQLHDDEAIIVDMSQSPYCDQSNPAALTMFLVTPMCLGERCIGLLIIDDGGDQHTYTLEEIALTRAVAKLISLAFERERLMREREQALQALQISNEELQAQNETVQQANRMKSEFLANMSHELRTPLNGIIGFTQLLQTVIAGPLNERQQEYLNTVTTSAKDLLRLINDVLDVAKIEAGTLTFSPEEIDIALLMQGVLQTMQPLIYQKRLHISLDLATAPLHVELDLGKLKQVLYNYLSNAIKFTLDQGQITVRLTLEDAGQFFRISVQDTGIGIAPTDLDHLFIPFHQLDSGTTKKYPGTGLGLALTKRIVEAQGGSVGVTSEIGSGSNFWAILPCVFPHNASHEERQQSSAIPTTTHH